MIVCISLLGETNGSNDVIAFRWEVDSVKFSDGIVLELAIPRSKEQEKWLSERGAGIYRVKIRTKVDSEFAKGSGSGGLGTGDVQLVCRL